LDKEEIIAIYNKPMMDFMKQLVSIENITIKRGSGFNIIVHKTGGCPEDCGYAQSRKIPHFSGRQRFDVG
jgi:biotin synthase